MSTTPNPTDDDRAAGSHLTVEDAGSTTSVSDLFENDTTATPRPDQDTRAGTADEHPVAAAEDAGAGVGSDPDAPSAPGAPEPPEAPTQGRAALVDDHTIAHVFDQTNGVIERLDGDSDGSAESDLRSSAERRSEPEGFDDALVEGDDDGVADLRDRNP